MGSDVKIAKDTMYKEKVSQKGCFFSFLEWDILVDWLLCVCHLGRCKKSGWRDRFFDARSYKGSICESHGL